METKNNPKDYQVVSFHNKEDFTFTPEMGCMYDGRAINGVHGSPGIDAGETKVLPYHIGNQLAKNLAKYVLNKGASKDTQLDATGQPIIKAIWDTSHLERVQQSYLTDMYTEERPAAQTETDKLFAKMAELEQFIKNNVSTPQGVEQAPEAPSVLETAPYSIEAAVVPTEAKKYLDKAEVITELEVRGIKHDKRSSKEALEKLLT